MVCLVAFCSVALSILIMRPFTVLCQPILLRDHSSRSRQKNWAKKAIEKTSPPLSLSAITILSTFACPKPENWETREWVCAQPKPSLFLRWEYCTTNESTGIFTVINLKHPRSKNANKGHDCCHGTTRQHLFFVWMTVRAGTSTTV